MPKLRTAIRYASKILIYTVCGSAAIFALLVIGKLALKAPQAMAASSTLYPRFCLGGWDHAQNASGQASLTPDDPASSYTLQNSAYLAAPVASQLFCGYFTSPEKTHPPTHVIVTFQWSMGDQGAAASSTSLPSAPESLSSDSGLIIATSTGFTVTQPQTTQAASSSSTTQQPSNGGGGGTPSSGSVPSSTNASTSTPQTFLIQPATSTPTTPPSDTSSSASSSTPASTDQQPSSAPSAPASDTTPPAASSPAPAPAPDPTPAPPAADPGTTVVTPPTSFIERALALAFSEAHAQADDHTQSQAGFLDVSYSLDGVRWTSVGTVGLDNWKGYTVAIPVSSWTDVNRLQIMLSAIPSVDKKPDIYLESMAVKIDYSRTVSEAVSDAVAAAADAMDGLLGTDAAATDTPAVEQPVVKPALVAPPAPQYTILTHKKLLLTLDGNPAAGPANLKADTASDGSSLTISGSCTKKYYVVLLYKNKTDYSTKPSSFVANEGHECDGGHFSYDLASLSPDIRDGSYYALIGEQGESGTWSATSEPFPVTIDATTTVEIIQQ